MKNIKISALLFLSFFLISVVAISENKSKDTNGNQIYASIIRAERSRIIHLADSFLLEKPVTVTSFTCPRSAGGIHDYYSEATYWWPDSANPTGPYIRKDGLNNPANFDFHRQAISQFS